LALVIGGVVGGCGGLGDDNTTTTAPAVTMSTSGVTSTAREPVTSTSLSTREELLAAFAGMVVASGVHVVAELEEDSLTESVDRLWYDAENGTVVLVVSSTLTGADDYDTNRALYDDQAWRITQGIARGWYSNEVVEACGGIALPAFRLELDGITYQVPGHVMTGITNGEVGMEDWLSLAGK
jgi:hypothetical protein